MCVCLLGAHLKAVIAKLNDLKEDKDIQGPCLNLLGYYHVAMGNVMEVYSCTMVYGGYMATAMMHYLIYSYLHVHVLYWYSR